MPRMSEVEQLAALARIHDLFERQGIAYWLFGGWAVDFHVRAITRAHDDIDIAVWRRDLPTIAVLLEKDGWTSAASGAEDGYTTYQRDGVQVDLAFLERGDEGLVYTPLRAGRASWPPGAFGDDVSELRGTRARLITRGALEADKSEPRDSGQVSSKDAADVAALGRRT
jgi:hypothetical protein